MNEIAAVKERRCGGQAKASKGKQRQAKASKGKQRQAKASKDKVEAMCLQCGRRDAAMLAVAMV
ncbi:TPA: hypothetical protein QDB64_002319 [Burkholderia multivorans]|nr:hypothetical protein [Burkholderia multivorans]